MNILQVVSSSATSGAEKHVIVLSQRLLQRGHTVLAVCPPNGWLPERLRAAGVPNVEMQMHGSHFCTAGFLLAQMARTAKIDLVHTHLTRAAHIGAMVARLNRIAMAASLHVHTHDMAFRQLFPRRRSRIITVSNFLRDSLLTMGVPAARVRTIYNGTEFGCSTDAAGERPGPAAAGETRPEDLNSLPVRAELCLPRDAELVGLFAHVGEFKGHLVLAQAIRAIVTARPQAYFVCVGSVESKMQRTLWEITARDGVADRLRFTGVRNDVQRLMAEMDVVTLPSRHEACSMAIIEAMALGKPVVATRAGGNPELILDNQTGLLIERTPEALAQALIYILSDSERRTLMGEAARCRVAARFSANVMVDQIESLYREILCAA